MLESVKYGNMKKKKWKWHLYHWIILVSNKLFKNPDECIFLKKPRWMYLSNWPDLKQTYSKEKLWHKDTTKTVQINHVAEISPTYCFTSTLLKSIIKCKWLSLKHKYNKWKWWGLKHKCSNSQREYQLEELKNLTFCALV